MSKIKPNGRSSDFISPNFIYGCMHHECMYCYTKRYKLDYTKYDVDKVLSQIEEHGKTLPVKTPNQCDDKYWLYDIACHTDIVRAINDYDWGKVFDYFVNSSNQKATFATKFYSKKLLDYSPKDKVRIRLSLMPQTMSYIMEPGTSKISTRIKGINSLWDKYEVHLNYSPVIVYDGWLKDYDELFKMVKNETPDTDCEVIFVTHSDRKHEQNKDFAHEHLLWNELQEPKTTSYGTSAYRYKRDLKYKLINKFKELYSKYWDVSNIRYIF